MKLMVSTHNWNSKVDSVIWDIHSELSKKFKKLHTFVYTPLLMAFYFILIVSKDHSLLFFKNCLWRLITGSTTTVCKTPIKMIDSKLWIFYKLASPSPSPSPVHTHSLCYLQLLKGQINHKFWKVCERFFWAGISDTLFLLKELMSLFLFIYFLIYGCVGSSFLCKGFL